MLRVARCRRQRCDRSTFVLRAALDRAVRWRCLSVNPAALVEPPAFERPEPDPPPAAAVAVLLGRAWQDPAWGTFVWLTMVTGCRRGEMCEPRWTDLDLERGILTVQRSLEQTATARREGPTKTRQKRRVALDEHTVDLLESHRGRCESDCGLLGIALPAGAFIFSASPDGSTPLCRTRSARSTAGRLGARGNRPAEHSPALRAPLLGDGTARRRSRSADGRRSAGPRLGWRHHAALLRGRGR